MLLKKGFFSTQYFFSAIYSSVTKFITQPTNIVLPKESSNMGEEWEREVKPALAIVATWKIACAPIISCKGLKF